MRGVKLIDLIRQADSGVLVLPNFQREFTYDRKKQHALLCSLFSGIPLGSVLLLEGGSKVQFSSRLVGRSSDYPLDKLPDRPMYLLDGQQRISTVWNALTDVYSSSDKTHDDLYAEIHKYLRSRWYLQFCIGEQFEVDPWGLKYLDCGEGFLVDRLTPSSVEEFIGYDNAVKGSRWNWEGSLGYPLIRPKSSTKIKEYKKFLDQNWAIPIHEIFSDELHTFVRKIGDRRRRNIQDQVNDLLSTPWVDFQKEERELFVRLFGVGSQGELSDLTKEMVGEVLQSQADSWVDGINRYLRRVAETQLGVLELREAYLKKAHDVFEAINIAGVKLSTYDLFCASQPKVDVRLKVNKYFPDSFGYKDDKTGVAATDLTNQLLNLIRVVAAFEGSCVTPTTMKSDVFDLGDWSLKERLDQILNSLKWAFDLLHSECGVPMLSEVPYSLQIVPLAFGHYRFGDTFKMAGKYHYWLALMSGRYREKQNERCGKDVEWIASLESSPRQGDFGDFEKDGNHWSAVLANTGYNDISTMLPVEGAEVEWRDRVTKSVLQWILSGNPRDFPGGSDGRLTTKTNLEKHHILPLAGSLSSIGTSTSTIRDDKGHFLNSPLNLCFISKDSNRAIGSMAYSVYEKGVTQDVKSQHCLPDDSSCVLATEDEQRSWLLRRHGMLRANIHTRLGSLWESLL